MEHTTKNHSSYKENCLNNSNTQKMNSKGQLYLKKQQKQFKDFKIKNTTSKIIVPHITLVSSKEGNFNYPQKQESHFCISSCDNFNNICSSNHNSQNFQQVNNFDHFSHNYQNYLKLQQNMQTSHLSEELQENQVINRNNISQKKFNSQNYSHLNSQPLCQYPHLFASQNNCKLANQHKESIKKDIQKTIKSIRKSQNQIQSLLVQELKKIKNSNNKSLQNKISRSGDSQNITKISYKKNQSQSHQSSINISSQELHQSLQKLKKIDHLQKIINKVLSTFNSDNSCQQISQEIINIHNTFAEQQYAEQILRQFVDQLQYNLRFKNQYIKKLEGQIQNLKKIQSEFQQNKYESSNKILQESERDEMSNNHFSRQLIDEKQIQCNYFQNIDSCLMFNQNQVQKGSLSLSLQSKKNNSNIDEGMQVFPILTDRNMLSQRMMNIYEQNQRIKRKIKSRLNICQVLQIIMINEPYFLNQTFVNQLNLKQINQKNEQQSLKSSSQIIKASFNCIQSKTMEIKIQNKYNQNKHLSNVQIQTQQQQIKQINDYNFSINKIDNKLNTSFGINLIKRFKSLVKVNIQLIKIILKQNLKKVIGLKCNIRNKVVQFADQFNKKYEQMKDLINLNYKNEVFKREDSQKKVNEILKDIINQMQRHINELVGVIDMKI